MPIAGAIASVVIPAHNEQAVIGRCLHALLFGAADGEFEVVVVANGCTDRTAEIAGSFPGVRVVATPTASKAAALNLGDASVVSFPRIFLDADVVLDTSAARAVAATLARPDGPMAAAPRMRVEQTGASVAARAYLDVWSALPVFRDGYVGSGCYALSAIGRGRFTKFPDVIGDDRFVNDLFLTSEKTTLPDVFLYVQGPRTWSALVRRSLRVQAGTSELRARFARPAPEGGASTPHALLAMARSPRRIPAVGLFVLTQLIVKILARYRRLRGLDGVWLRDDTSRG